MYKKSSLEPGKKVCKKKAVHNKCSKELGKKVCKRRSKELGKKV